MPFTTSLTAAMHDTDPIFRRWSRSAQAAELLEDLGYKRPLPVQSMYIFKVGGDTILFSGHIHHCMFACSNTGHTISEL